MDKESAISKLLQPAGGSAALKPGASLISEVGADGEPKNTGANETPPSASHGIDVSAPPLSPTPPPHVDEGPTMLEMMMAAQMEAQKEKNENKEIEKKSNFSGFKKGFFGGSGGGGSSGSSKKAQSDNSSATSSATKTKSSNGPEIIEVKKKGTAIGDGKAGKKNSSSLVFDDVQKAMEEDTHPMLKSLKSNGK